MVTAVVWASVVVAVRMASENKRVSRSRRMVTSQSGILNFTTLGGRRRRACQTNPQCPDAPCVVVYEHERVRGALCLYTGIFFSRRRYTGIIQSLSA